MKVSNPWGHPQLSSIFVRDYPCNKGIPPPFLGIPHKGTPHRLLLQAPVSMTPKRLLNLTKWNSILKNGNSSCYANHLNGP